MTKLCTFGLLVGICLGLGCTRRLDDHCGNLDGNASCADRGGFCALCRLENDGCVDVLPAEGCHYPGAGEEVSSGSTTSGGDAIESTSMGDTVNGSSTTSGLPACTVDTQEQDCPDATPFCKSERCVSCDETSDPDGACLGLDPMAPLCVGVECVQCSELQAGPCDDQLLVCDTASNACAPCTEHDQCSSGACDIFEGTCFDPVTVVEVGGAGQPATIAAGLEELDALWPDVLGERRGLLVLHAGLVDFDETVTIQDDSPLGTDAGAMAFIAAQGESPSWVYTAVMPEAPTLSVRGATTRVYLDGIALRGNQGINDRWGIRCDGARVDIRRSQVVANAGGGIEALGQCELHVENSFVGGDENDRDALLVGDDEVTATILYSTLGAGFGDGTAAALRCVTGAAVDVRNSVLVARTSTPEVVGASAELTSNATEARDLGDMSLGWFSSFATGDFHLSASAPSGIVVADWELGDPTTDIDGQARITDEGMLDHAGADVP